MTSKYTYFKSLLCLVVIAVATTVYVLINDRVLFRTLEYIWEDTGLNESSNLMLGSSSIARMNSKQYLHCSQWLNRGMGNATIADIDRYLTFTPLPLKPPMILIYAGENDISQGMNVTETLAAYKALIHKLIERFPESTLHILGIKPSPAREQHWQNFSKLNKELQQFIDTTEKVYFYSFPEFGSKINNLLFTTDGIHFTETGYVTFTSELNKRCSTQ